MPMTDAASSTVFETRNAICNVLAGRGQAPGRGCRPCSIHDTKARDEYATKPKAVMEECSNELIVVMRVYFEKPRTTIGWKGPHQTILLDQSYKISERPPHRARLLLDFAEMGVPAGTEFLDMISPQYVAGPHQLGSIGARTAKARSSPAGSGLSAP